MDPFQTGLFWYCLNFWLSIGEKTTAGACLVAGDLCVVEGGSVMARQPAGSWSARLLAWVFGAIILSLWSTVCTGFTGFKYVSRSEDYYAGGTMLRRVFGHRHRKESMEDSMNQETEIRKPTIARRRLLKVCGRYACFKLCRDADTSMIGLSVC